MPRKMLRKYWFTFEETYERGLNAPAGRRVSRPTDVTPKGLNWASVEECSSSISRGGPDWSPNIRQSHPARPELLAWGERRVASSLGMVLSAYAPLS